MKRRPTHMSSGRCKGKQHGDTTPVRKAHVQSTSSPDASGRGAAGPVSIAGRHSGRQFGAFVKTKSILPSDTATTLLGVYPKESRTYVHMKTCTEALIAALFITVKPGSSQEVLQSAVGKPTPEHPNNGVLLKAKKKQAIKS